MTKDTLLCDSIFKKIKLVIKDILLSREQDDKGKTLINLMDTDEDEVNSEIKRFLFEDIFLPYVEMVEFIEILQQKFNLYLDDDIFKKWETIDDCERDMTILISRRI